jgi:drug/metabolite transporter (DMT)-like permease
VSASAPPSARRATLLLVVVTLLWGMSFPLMKSWQNAAKDAPGGEALASTTLIALRMILAMLVLAPLKPGLVYRPTRREQLTGAAIGFVFWAGFSLQVWGLAQTTPALSGFITSLGSAWVPLLALVFLRTQIAGVTLAGLGVGAAGTAVLGLDWQHGWALGGGEGRTLLASVLFAVEILLLDRLGKRVRSDHLTMPFMAVTAVLATALTLALAAAGPGVGAWLAWLIDLLSRPAVVRDLVLLVLLPTALAFHWMNVYQPRVSAGRAALIYLLEPVFAAAFSVAWGHDDLTARLFLGGGLILAGNLLIEVPYWVQHWRRSRGDNGA